MSFLAAHVTPRARLFEYIRQEDVAQARAPVPETRVAANAMIVFQTVALRSLQPRKD